MKLRSTLTVPALLIAALHTLACGGGDGSKSTVTPAGETGGGGTTSGSGSGGSKSTASGNGSVGIKSFEAEKSVVEIGKSVTLSWELQGEPDELTLDGEDVLGSGSAKVTPRRRQQFELSARFGDETFTATVEVAARGIELLAGSERGPGNADGDLESARFESPAALTYDSAGNLYVSDWWDCTVRKIDTEGNVTTLAGDPLACDGQDGQGTDAHFGGVNGLAAAEDGTLYVADSRGMTIRKIDPEGNVTTLAGKFNEAGAVDGTGDEARFRWPNSLVLLPDGDLLVADSGAYAIRRVTPEGKVTTEYGVLDAQGTADSPAPPQFSNPYAIALGDGGDLFVADGCAIRRITSAGVVSHYAGDSLNQCGKVYGSAAGSKFDRIYGLTVLDGALYFQDTATYQLLRIVDDQVEVFSGIESDHRGIPRDGTAESAVLGMVWGMTASPEGELVLAEAYGALVRKVDEDGNVRRFAGQTTPNGHMDGPTGVSRLGWAIDLAKDEANHLLMVDYGQNSLRSLDAEGVTRTLAGGNGSGYLDGAAPDALFEYPTGVLATENDSYFVVDRAGIRKLANNQVSLFAGTPGAESPADGPLGEGALSGGGKLVRTEGAFYLADTWGSDIRRIDDDGTITTIAGVGYEDYADGKGSDAAFDSPESIALLPDGDLVVADAGNFVLRRVTLEGKVTTLAGVPREPGYTDGPLGEGKLGYVTDLAVAPSGDIFLVETTYHTVRKLTPEGTLSTIAGTPGRSGTELGKLPGVLRDPGAIEVNAAGDLFVGTGAAVVQITAP